MSPRLRKYAKLLQTPGCWPALLHGVAATLDHDTALGRDRFATVIDVGAKRDNSPSMHAPVGQRPA